MPSRGFTLIEVLVAIVVMTIGVVGLLSIFPQALGTTRTAGHVSTLNRLATEKLEELRSIDYASSDLSIGTHPSQGSDSNGDKYYPVSGFAEAYSLRWIVSAGPTTVGGTAEPDMKTVRVEATYRVRYTTGGDVIATTGGTTAVFQTFLAE